MTISYTIENENDWILLLNIINKNVIWNDKTTNTLKQSIYNIQSEYYKNNNLYGIYDIQINSITYINLIIKCKSNSDQDSMIIMICDYPKQTINLTNNKTNLWKYIGIGIVTITILCGILYKYT